MKVLDALKLKKLGRIIPNLPVLKARAPLVGLIVSYVGSVFVAMWNNHKDRQWNGFGLNANVRDALDAWGSSDPASYLMLGHEIYSTGNIPENLWWIINLWAPGQAWIYLGGLRLGGEGGFILVLFLFDSFLWFLALLAIRSALKDLVGDTTICFALALYAVFSEFQEHILGQVILYSDGSAAAILIILIFKLRTYWSQQGLRESVFNGVIIGFCIVAVTYLRSQNRYLLHAIVLLMLVSAAKFIWELFRGIIKVGHPRKPQLPLRTLLLVHARRSRSLRIGLSSGLSTLIILFCLAPYLMWKGSTVGDVGWDFGGKYALTSGDALVFPQNWLKEEQLASWQFQGGGGWACRIDPLTCSEVHEAELVSPNPWNIYDDEPFSASDFRQMSVETILTNPIDFFLDRTRFLVQYLFSETSLVTPSRTPSTLRLVQFVTAAMALVKLHLTSRRSKSQNIMGVWFGLITLSLITVAPPMLINFEVRYLLALRVLINILFFIGLSMLCITTLDKLKCSRLRYLRALTYARRPNQVC